MSNLPSSAESSMVIESTGLDLRQRADIHSLAAEMGRRVVFSDFDELISTDALHGIEPEGYVGLEHLLAFNDDSIGLSHPVVATLHGKIIDRERTGVTAANDFLQGTENPAFDDLYVPYHGDGYGRFRQRNLSYLYSRGKETKLAVAQQAKQDALDIGQANVTPVTGLILATRKDAGMPQLDVPSPTSLATVQIQEVTANMAINAESFAVTFGEKYTTVDSISHAAAYLAHLVGKKLATEFAEQNAR